MEKKLEMTQEREYAILNGAIRKWGNKLQILVAIEELSELQKALCKYLRYLGTNEDGESLSCAEADIREETADVYIMLHQLELIFGDTAEEQTVKLERLERMVGIDPQQTLAEPQGDGTYKLSDPPSRGTPEDVAIVRASRTLYPSMRHIVRTAGGVVYATDRLGIDPLSHVARIKSGAFCNLERGDAVLIDDILAEGGDEA